MSLPSIFEYLPEQARELCKMASLRMGDLPAVFGVATGVGAGLKGAMDPKEEHPARAALLRGALVGGTTYGAGKVLRGPLISAGAALGKKLQTPSSSWNRPLQGAVLGSFAAPVLGAAVSQATADPVAAHALRALREREKTAEDHEPTTGQKLQNAAKVYGTGLLGFATGSLAGAGSAYLADKWYEAATGKKIPTSALHVAAPLVGGAAGLAYNLYQAKQQEELRRALASKPDQSQGRVSPK